MCHRDQKSPSPVARYGLLKFSISLKPIIRPTPRAMSV